MSERSIIWIAVVVLAIMLPLGLVCGARGRGGASAVGPVVPTGAPRVRLYWHGQSARVQNLTSGPISIQCTAFVRAVVEQGPFTKTTETPDPMTFGSDLFATIAAGGSAEGRFKLFTLTALPSGVTVMDGDGKPVAFEERAE